MSPFSQPAVDIASSESLAAALQRLAPFSDVAVDLEADALHAFKARLCFVQLGTDQDIFLLDTLNREVDASRLSPLMTSSTCTKFFHAAGGDLQFLAEVGIRVNNLFDTHRAATLLGWPKVGLADLVKERLGVELKKEHQQSDFSLRPLPPAMREYIADDVRYLCEVGRQVRAECVKADIMEEVNLDCHRACNEATERPDAALNFNPKLSKTAVPKERWWMAIAFARQLHVFRLRWAEASNVPMGRMLSNAAIAEIATHLPQDLKSLGKTYGVRGPFVREHGEEVLQTLQQFLLRAKQGEFDASGIEKLDRDPRRRKREDSLRVFRAEKATQRHVTPSVVLPNPLLELLAASPPANVEALAQLPYLGEKRARLYGEEIVSLLSSI